MSRLLSEQGKNFVASHHVGDLVVGKPDLVEVEETTSITKVLETCNEKNIRGVGVYALEPGGRQKTYLGTLSTFDVVSYLSLAPYFQSRGASLDSVFNKMHLDSLTVADLLGQMSSESSKLWLFQPRDNLAMAAEYFCKGVHRALVHDAERGIVQKMVTQCDLINFLLVHEKELGDVLRTRISELNLCWTPPQRLNEKDSALQGFQLMVESAVQALPVVDDAGRILSTLSTRDLAKQFSAQSLNSMTLPVGRYLRDLHDGRLVHPITCTPESSLLDVMLKMKAATLHKHQVWVVDSTQRPVGVVTTSDVIRVIYRAYQGFI